MTDEHKQEMIIKCTGCKKHFFEDGFKVNRLGRRLKTCLECNERARLHSLRYQERKRLGTVNTDHGKLSKKDPSRIDQEARRRFGFKLVNPEDYINVKTRVEWECLACQHRFSGQWKTLCVIKNCYGPKHGKEKAPEPAKAPQLTDDELAEALDEFGF